MKARKKTPSQPASAPGNDRNRSSGAVSLPRCAPAAASAPRTVALVSLGCPKNLVDSEKMLGLLAEDGLTPVPSDAPADAVVINTCGFLEASKEESLGEIRQAIARKQAGQVRRVIVAGCLVQRHRAKLLQWCPEIDALIGVFDRDRVVEAVRGTPEATQSARHLSDTPLPVYASIAANATQAKQERAIAATGYFESDAARLRLTPRHYAYLRLSEGCNQNCAFCTIPSIRGKMRSKPVDAVLAELRELLSDGAFEINLIGQDTTSYGSDIGYAPGLVGLLEALDRCAAAEGGAWLRLMYAYPSCFTDAMIDAIAALPHVVKYIDMPLQHISDPVLHAMRRHTSRHLIEKLLHKLRERVPGLAIRTTFISGFPGETDRQHRELVKFIRDFGFDALGVFPYSPEPGTPAGTLHASGQAVPEEIVRGRVEELMLTQQEVVFARNARLARTGVEVDVLIDHVEPAPGSFPGSAPGNIPGSTPGNVLGNAPAIENTSGNVSANKRAAACCTALGRTPGQAPQVDALTRVASRQPLTPGEVIRCRVTGYQDYDLLAQPLADLSRRVSLPVT